MVVKVKEKFEKLDMLKIMIMIKNIFYEDIEVYDIMKEFYPKKETLKFQFYF